MSAPQDNSLLCPVCDYNLTGLPENRCPECGTPFDLEELAAIARGVPQPLWALQGGQVSQVALLWWTTLTAPRSFARRFPPVHPAEQAIAYTLACYLVAAVLFCVGAAWRPDAGLGICLAIVAGSAFACYLCEMCLAAVLVILLCPTRAKRSYHFWRGLTHCTSGFVVFTALWGVAAVYLEPDLPPRWSHASEMLAWCAAFAIFVWWTTTLCLMIIERSRPGLRRWIACLLVPLIGLGAILVGFWASFGCALLCVLPRW